MGFLGMRDDVFLPPTPEELARIEARKIAERDYHLLRVEAMKEELGEGWSAWNEPVELNDESEPLSLQEAFIVKRMLDELYGLDPIPDKPGTYERAGILIEIIETPFGLIRLSKHRMFSDD